MSINKYKLGQIAEILTGFPFSGSKYNESTGIKVVRGENVTIGDLRWDTTKYWNLEFPEQSKYELRTGDIVIGMDGSRVGKNRAQIKTSDLPLLLAQRVACIRAKSGFNQDFLSYVIKSEIFEKYVDSIKTGTSIPHISGQQIKDFEFSAPPLEEQRRIASILTALDDKIELNRRMNTTLEGIAGALWEEWFGKYVREGAELPEGWTNQSMGDLIDTISKTYKFNKEEIIFLNTSDILNGVVLNNNYTSVSGLPGQAKKSIQRNDILFSEIRPANRRFAFVNFSPEDYVVSTKLMVLRSKGKVPPLFLYFFLTRQETLDHLQMLAESRSGTFPQITFDHVKSLNIPFPDDDQIERFSKLLETIYGSIFENSNQITTLTHLRDTLLPRLMRGE